MAAKCSKGVGAWRWHLLSVEARHRIERWCRLLRIRTSVL